MIKQALKKPYVYFFILIFFVYLTIDVLLSQFYITILISYIKYKQRQNIKKGAAVAAIGTTGGFAAGVCTACVAGIFPFVFSLFGVSFSWISLPFNGLEFQVFVIILLIISLYLLNKKS